ncbi:hypothetical protein [Psychrobacillus vulpis]|uniref:YqgU-like 6-bladed beta-propeller domain-containing protein n=1 Tax=Psychrobacillus vulpis TaxID=2325572 RepID=A0A544TQ29_9BACI|nr:hypothetical protein [Psychrobacillus vulpis]TQR19550.1 hypothetical protein FG384_11495 [Psychrobacillus vulpis]
MKKIGILIICMLLLQACQDSKVQVEVKQPKRNMEETSLPSVSPTIPPKAFPSISFAPSAFQCVVGWLSNDEVVFILSDKGKWTVQTYSVSRESWKLIYTSPIPIVQAIIHPNKELILLHTSSNSSSAEVQVLHKNGYLVHSLSFESAELYMDWHPTNPDLIVFTTFYEDWSYNTFVYDGSTQVLESIEVENPFVKWYDEQHLMVFTGSESSLDGSELMLYSLNDKSLKSTGINHLLDVQNLGESMLYIHINEQENVYEYRLVSIESGDSFEWTSPTISNYSEWVIPTISVIEPNKIIAIKSVESGNVDENDKRGIISSISLEGEKELGEITSQPIACAPNGEICLGGYEKENWIQLKPLKEKLWIHLNE